MELLDDLDAAFDRLRREPAQDIEPILVALLERAMEAADAPAEVFARASLGQCLARQDRWLDAVDHLTRACELAKDRGLDPGLAPLDLGLVVYRLGDPARAIEIYSGALRDLKDHPDAHGRISQLLNNRGHAHLRVDQLALAIHDLRAALSIGLEHDQRNTIRGARVGLIVALCRSGELAEARRELTELERWTDAIKAPPWHRAHVRWARAHVRLAFHEAGAREEAEACVVAADRPGMKHELREALLLAARACAAENDPAAAYAFQQRATSIGEELSRTRVEDALTIQATRHRAEVEHVRNVELARVNEELRAVLERERAQARELEEARDRAERAVDARAWFLAVVSHELRTPLNGILGATTLLGATPLTDDQRELVQIAKDSSELMLDHVSDLLDAAKLEAGTLTLDRIPVDLPELLHGALSVVRHTAEAKGLSIVLDPDPDLPRRVTADPRRLRQILLNLVGNAVKFTETGEVRVTAARAENGQVEIAVRDSGPGIPQADLHRIFKPFEQAGAIRETREGGTGLGLAIAQQLANLHDGEITAQNAPQGGALFTFRAPLVAEPAPVETKPDPAPTDRIDLEGLQVLLVDDDRIARTVGQGILRQLGVGVHAVDGGPAAMEAVATANPDIILLDWMMPVMDGPEVAMKLREQGYSGPILALTANVAEDLRKRGEEAGIQAVYTKPIRPAVLASALHTWAGWEAA